MHPYVRSAVIAPAVVGMILAARCEASGQTKLGTRTNPGTALGIVRRPAPFPPMITGLWLFRLPVPDPKSSDPNSRSTFAAATSLGSICKANGTH